MRVGIVSQWYSSGAGHVSRAYSDVLQTIHHVYIYARGGKNMIGTEEWGQPNVTWAPRHSSSTGVWRTHFVRWIRRNEIDVVIFNEQRHWEAVITAREAGVVTGAYIDYYTQDTVPLFGLYDFLICNTKRHFSVFREHPQCVYIPWGTHTDIYAPRLKCANRSLTFIISAGWCGVHAKWAEWHDRRGVGVAMRAFRQLSGDCRLIVLSQAPLRECAEEWRRLVSKDSRIEFREGTFDPVPYWDGDVYVYPSRLDGIGLTLPEALSCGVPAVATDCAPMNEFVRDGVNGSLCPVAEFRGRPDGYFWAESVCSEIALAELCQHYVDDPSLAVRQSIAAREDAEKNLCWRTNAKNLAEWIAQRRILGDRETVRLAALSQDARRYDRLHSPTPTQQCARSAKLFVTGWLSRFGGARIGGV